MAFRYLSFQIMADVNCTGDLHANPIITSTVCAYKFPCGIDVTWCLSSVRWLAAFYRPLGSKILFRLSACPFRCSLLLFRPFGTLRRWPFSCSAALGLRFGQVKQADYTEKGTWPLSFTALNGNASESHSFQHIWLAPTSTCGSNNSETSTTTPFRIETQSLVKTHWLQSGQYFCVEFISKWSLLTSARPSTWCRLSEESVTIIRPTIGFRCAKCKKVRVHFRMLKPNNENEMGFYWKL